jgi:cation:H+ antiporter
MVWILFLAGLGLLLGGAELLVRGAKGLATALGIPPLIVGLTVVAFGTSAPELAVSVRAALAGQDGVALGNIAGSNIFNVLFILGASAAARPLIAATTLIRREVPLMIGVSLLTAWLARDLRISRWEGVLLLVGVVAYTIFAIRSSPREEGGAGARGKAAVQLAFLLGGGAGLVIGAGWMVDGAVQMARLLGVSETTIALTIIAAGTGLPEAATSVMATVRGERDIAVGNVVGSNIFNLLGILGAAAVTAPHGLAVPAQMLRVDLPVMVVTAAACLPVFFTGRTISRVEGWLLLWGYVAYTAYLIRQAAP